MIVRFKIPDMSDEKSQKIFCEFEAENDFCLTLMSFGKHCGEFDYFYSYLDEKSKKSFLNILILNGVEVFSADDFTSDFINILLTNKIEEFRKVLDAETVLFDELIEDIYLNEITKENVLDKINNLGIDSLNENDYKVLSA